MASEEIIVKYLDNNEIINKFYSESNKRFNERLKYINILEKNNIIWKDALKLSKIWYNIKYNGCKYNSILYNQYIKFNKEYENKFKNLNKN